jgi:hypothetical protein
MADTGTLTETTTGAVAIKGSRGRLIGTVPAAGRLAAGAPQATISDPSGGATQDAEARTAINALIDALQAFGIVK